MNKFIVALLVCVSGCYISQKVQAAADDVGFFASHGSARSGSAAKKATANNMVVRSLPSAEDAQGSMSEDNYSTLESGLARMHNKSRRLATLGKIEQAHVWDDFKLIYQEMKLAGQEGLQQEKLKNLKRKLEDEKIGRFVSYGSCGSLHYAKKHLEKEKKKTDNTRARQRILEFIQQVGITSIDEELLAMMSEFEGHGPNMQDQIAQQQRDAELAIESFKVELSWYTKEWFAMGEMSGYTVKKREDLGG